MSAVDAGLDRAVLDALDAHCERLLTDEKVPSISVAVGVGDEIVATRAYGFADVAARRRPDADTPYLLASVTKSIVSTGVVLLHDRGQIDLDHPIEDYLGGLRLPRAAGVTGSPTVRQILGHVGGLGTYWDFYYADRQPTPPPFAQTVERYCTLFREPGTAYEYSNLGYGLCDELIAQVTGTTSAEFATREIFTPLGLSSGHIGASYAGEVPPAQRYPTGPFDAYADYDTSHPGASMAWLSARDLARFGLSHCGVNSVLSPAGLEAAHRPGTTSAGAPTGYALGWGVREPNGVQVRSHGGDMGGVGTVLVIVPEHRIAVAALINRTESCSLARSVAHLVLEALVPGFYPPPADDETPWNEPPLTPGPWTGNVHTYVGDVPIALDVAADGTVSGTVGDGPTVTTGFDAREAEDVFAVNLKLPTPFPTPDSADSSHTWLCLDANGDTATGAVRAIHRGEPGGRVGDCRSHLLDLRYRG